MLRTPQNAIRTFTGKQFWPLDPRPEDVCIEDIAHALSMKCRYGGHSQRFYSVAEHSRRMRDHATPANRFAALMHDGGEYVLPDMVRPVKKDARMAAFKLIEEPVELAISAKLGVPFPYPQEVHDLDWSILTDEMIELVPYGDWLKEDGSWNYGAPLGINGTELGWPPDMAERLFLEAYYIDRPNQGS